ncbi:hypothetical protein LQ757_06015 [Agromyces sp. SYSU K20354]|uniref:hypothetical protein n=1 Tax=Agromyces cavernae TaxID=2898659 RepID=UPI001E53661B|nr:hypothetical protein [Agromyces cavernae]MCD2441832.1 hypothetical protein [Agromyces cavernae]
MSASGACRGGARRLIHTATGGVLLAGLLSLIGCAQSPAAAPTAVETPQLIRCDGSTNIYEPNPDAGAVTVEQALKDRIAWLAETGVKNPPTNGSETFSLYPELNTMEVALAAFQAGRHVDRNLYRGLEIITIHAIDADGKDTGEVVIDELEPGYFVGQVVVRSMAARAEDCP